MPGIEHMKAKPSGDDVNGAYPGYQSGSGGSQPPLRSRGIK